jgi:nucleotide-binding universal stress UspA family protein
MFKLERILFPVDFSDRASRAAADAHSLARVFGAEVILLHVVQPLSYNSYLGEAAGSHWQSFAKELSDPGLHVSRLTEHGDITEKIIELAKTRHADLILMPTHGLGVYRRLILGSNTAKVLHDADCPVWTGVHHETEPHREMDKVKHVVCAVNLDASSQRILAWAAGFAARYHATLTLLHLAADPIGALPALQDLLDAAAISAQLRVEPGDPAKAVPHLAAELGASILVVGRPLGSPGWGRLELTTYSIIRQSPCPVVSV